MYQKFTDLNVGFSNAENYRRRENKQLLTQYFVKDHFLDKLLSSSVYFLVGEKGTGKTAYATYLTNSKYKNTVSKSFDVRQTEYQKFLELKKQGHLPISHYSEVWATLLLMAAAESILENSGKPDFLKRFTKLAALKQAIQEFYQNAFSPELVQMLTFVESSEKALSLIAKYKESGFERNGAKSAEITSTVAQFQLNLMKIRRSFEDAIRALSLEEDFIVFIDGIDVRPTGISYADYFECVGGLVDAVWAVNSDFLANIKDSKGRIRIVLLIRPDIMLKTGLHNMNTKLSDNSVYLNWVTAYKDYQSSHLFRVADRLLSAQQPPEDNRQIGDCWNYYFPFHAENVKSQEVSAESGTNSFLSFLRLSYHRPRDINTMIKLLQERLAKTNETPEYVSGETFEDSSFRDDLANYLLGEIRDQLLFYYSQDEYDAFLQFFSHLRGKIKFTYDDYANAFNQFVEEATERNLKLPQFFESPNSFLQFLYEQNVLCYKEDGIEKNGKNSKFIRWCFRERTLSNMAPKVRIGVEYEVFQGLSKALNVGRKLNVKASSRTRQTGTVIKLDIEKKFGFIRSGEFNSEYYFKLDDLEPIDLQRIQVADLVSFVSSVKYTKLRALQVKRDRR